MQVALRAAKFIACFNACQTLCARGTLVAPLAPVMQCIAFHINVMHTLICAITNDTVLRRQGTLQTTTTVQSTLALHWSDSSIMHVVNMQESRES